MCRTALSLVQFVLCQSFSLSFEVSTCFNFWEYNFSDQQNDICSFLESDFSKTCFFSSKSLEMIEIMKNHQNHALQIRFPHGSCPGTNDLSDSTARNWWP